MSSKGYPTSGAVAAFGPDPRGRIGGLILFIYDEMSTRRTPLRPTFGHAPVPQLQQKLFRAITRSPVMEAFKLGWWFGEKLYDWLHAKRELPPGWSETCRSLTYNQVDCTSSGWTAGGFWCESVTAYATPCEFDVTPGHKEGWHMYDPNPFWVMTRVWDRSSGTEPFALPREFLIPDKRPDPRRPDEDYRRWPEPEPYVDPELQDPPWWNPEDMPVIPHHGEWPAPGFGRIPWLNRQNLPNRQTGPRPGEQLRPLPFENLRPSEFPGQRIDFRVVPRELAPPRERPLEDLRPLPDTGGPRWDDVVVRRKPPTRAREKEIKLRTNSRGLRLIKGIVNGVTETLDLLDALHDALPKDCKTRPKKGAGGGVTPQQKFNDVYRCADRIDFCDAIHNIVENQVEDLIYGSASKKLGAPTGERMGRPVGPQAGMIDRPERGKAKSSKQSRDYYKDLEPGEVVADAVQAVMDEIGACN